MEAIANKYNGFSVEQLYEAYEVSAQIVAKFGDAYLPVFERMHREIQQIEKTKDLKALALNVSCGKIGIDKRE